MTTPNEDPLKDLHPVKRTISHNAMNVAQPGDYLPTSAVENLGLKVGDDDDSDVGPAGGSPVEVTFQEPEVRYDKPVIPPAGPLGNTAGEPATRATVEPASESDRPAKTTRRKATTSADQSDDSDGSDNA